MVIAFACGDRGPRTQVRSPLAATARADLFLISIYNLFMFSSRSKVKVIYFGIFKKNLPTIKVYIRYQNSRSTHYV